ncbi:MAG: lipopolysaccharide heptosyltransferase I [Pseudolabrys sp.]
MADILFIKTSSLGDVIHNMPALTDARRARPGDRFTWLVEEDCVPLVRLHPAVDEVIPVASRRWRRDGLMSFGVLREALAFRRELQARRFDLTIDTQGLFRTGLMAWFARGTRHGYDRSSIREPLASSFYDVRHSVSRELHAIERNRRLAALALGYAPDGPADFGLNRSALRGNDAPYAVLLHATARADKEWPVENWIALRDALARRNVDLLLPWGRDDERARATLIAQGLPRARVVDRLPLDGVARLIAGASFVIGVDTGIMHLAAALGVPLVAIFAGSQPALTGPVGQGPIETVGTKGAPPSVDEVAQALARIDR